MTAAPSYSATAKLLHWLIVVLLIVQYVVGYLMPHIGRNTVPETYINTHFSFGVMVIAVALVRLLWRATHPAPPPAAGVPAWQMWIAHAVHWLLYALLVAVPLLGWINASWRGFPVYLFGFEMPKLIATRAAGWRWTGDVHEIMSWYVLLPLIGLHVVAALYHFFIRRNGVLQRMLPLRG